MISCFSYVNYQNKPVTGTNCLPFCEIQEETLINIFPKFKVLNTHSVVQKQTCPQNCLKNARLILEPQIAPNTRYNMNDTWVHRAMWYKQLKKLYAMQGFNCINYLLTNNLHMLISSWTYLWCGHSSLECWPQTWSPLDFSLGAWVFSGQSGSSQGFRPDPWPGPGCVFHPSGPLSKNQSGVLYWCGFCMMVTTHCT